MQLSKEWYDQVFFYYVYLFFSRLVELWSGPFCKLQVSSVSVFMANKQHTEINYTIQVAISDYRVE